MALPPDHSREQPLDELAKVFALAAVDAFLLEQEADTKPFVTSAKHAGGGVHIEQILAAYKGLQTRKATP